MLNPYWLFSAVDGHSAGGSVLRPDARCSGDVLRDTWSKGEAVDPPPPPGDSSSLNSSDSISAVHRLLRAELIIFVSFTNIFNNSILIFFLA